MFPNRKCEFFRKVKENKGLHGGVLAYTAQTAPPIDAEIAKKAIYGRKPANQSLRLPTISLMEAMLFSSR